MTTQKIDNYCAPNVIGNVPKFDHEINAFHVFKVQLMQFFVANDLKNEVQKKALFITALSESSYLLLKNLLNPALPEDDTIKLDTCLNALEEHLKPVVSAFMERYRFYAAQKEQSESINQWAVRVQGLAVNCQFGVMLETALRDKFVMGLERGPAREKIFLEGIDKATFKKSVEIATAAEYIQQQSKEEALTGNCMYMSSGAGKKKQHQLQHINRGQRQQQNKQHQHKQVNQQKCAVCGYFNHKAENCKFKNYKCNNCKKKGHLKNMCNQVECNLIENNDYINLFAFVGYGDEPIKLQVEIDRRKLVTELDTGTQPCVMPLEVFADKFKKVEMASTQLLLRTYGGTVMKPEGTVKFEVKYNGLCRKLDFIIVKEKGPILLGREFLKKFNVSFSDINCLKTMSMNDKWIEKFPKLFDGSLGCFNKLEAKLILKEDSKPKFFKPRPLPLAIKEKVELEIDKLVKLGVLEPVDFSEWGTPIVPILKKNGEVRICGDFKVTLNPCLQVEKYPLPRIEDIFSKLYKGKEFSKLDLSMAYQQIKLDVESKNFTTISTTKGLFRYNRLIYGLATAPAIFQRIMDTLFASVDGVAVFLDDILITAPTREKHEEKLKIVLNILEEVGFKLAREKCVFFSKQIEYLGHIIDKDGLRPNKSKIELINSIPYPKNIKEVQSLLGVVNFYRKFVPKVSSVCEPLYNLLKANVKFKWTVSCSKAVDQLKDLLKADISLAHFNPELKTKVTVDASPSGVAAVLSQIELDGKERPIEFASRTLSAAEKNYSQLDREAVAILFGVKKFHQYIFGRRFTLVTDNKPLQHIFGPKKGIPAIAANRLQRVALTLSAFDFDISCVKSEQNTADYFSRYNFSSINDADFEEQDLPDCVHFNYVTQVRKFPLNIDRVKEETGNDANLQQILKWVKEQWPDKVGRSELIPFWNRRFELSEEGGCLFWGYRIVIPSTLQSEVLALLHKTHMGIVKMKSMARECCWWPSQSEDIEKISKGCEACLSTRQDPPKEELKVWKWAEKPWERVHIDFFGPILNRWFLIVIDSCSKWLECIEMGKNTTSSATISRLRDLFARFGLPNILVSDNGTSFVSKEFKNFLERNGIIHITTPVGNPATNGLAENAVKTVKSFIKKCMHDNNTRLNTDRLHRFLFDYRNSAHGTTGVAPSYLMFGRQLKTRLDLLNPKRQVICQQELVKDQVVHKQTIQAKNYKGKLNNSFEVGDVVMARDYSKPGQRSWKKCKIEKKLGKQTFLVRAIEAKSNNVWKRHANQIIASASPESQNGRVASILTNPLIPLPTSDDPENITRNNCSPRYNLRSRKKRNPQV